MNAMDFDDLLVRSVNLLELFQEVRDRYASAFRWVMVDEYQDTNHVQYRWLQLLTSEHRNLAVVGDDAQCLVAGTRSRWATARPKPIEAVEPATRCCSCYGSGDFRPAARRRTRSASARSMGVEITHARRPPDRQHPGAHALRGLSRRAHAATAPDVSDVAPRQGLPRRHDAYPARGPAPAGARSADPLGAGARGRRVGAVDARRPRRRRAPPRQLYALRLRHPDAAVRRAPGRSVNGLVHDQALIDSVFAGVDTYADGLRLLRDEHLDFEAPHHVPLSFEGRRRNVTLTLCGDRRGGGRCTRSPSAAATRRRATPRGGWAHVRPAKQGSPSWRYESLLHRLRRARWRPSTASGWRSRVSIARRSARLGGSKSLPFMPAASVRPGMVDVHRGRRVRPRRVRRARPARPRRSTTSTSRTRTTSSPTGSSPTTRSTASAAPTSGTSSISRTTTPTRTSSSSSRTTARRRRSWTPRTR